MLKRIQLRPGVNKENTRYTNENGWYISDKVRFRQGTPEKKKFKSIITIRLIRFL